MKKNPKIESVFGATAVADNDELSYTIPDSWEEGTHPRAEDGKFGSGGSSKTKVSRNELRKKLEGLSKDQLTRSLNNKDVDATIKKEIERELDDRANRGS
jgi:hypothetical protein